MARKPKPLFNIPSDDPDLLLDQDTPEGAMAAQARLPHYTEFRKPVGIQFLANIVGKQPKQIAKRLEKCPVVEWETLTRPKYDFMTAMEYLVTPRGNIEDWFAQQNMATLPPYINKMFWEASAARNRVMLESNDLWHTDDVMVLFGRVSSLIRSHTNLWIESLPKRDILTTEQYNALVDKKNELLDELREALTNIPRETLSMTAHIASDVESADLSALDHIGDVEDE